MKFKEVCVRLGPGGGEARTPTSRHELYRPSWSSALEAWLAHPAMARDVMDR